MSSSVNSRLPLHDALPICFIAVGKKPLPDGHRKPDLHKTSLLVTLPSDYPGALHQVLSAFAWRQLNLCRIESRPTKKGLGSYHFFIDVEKDRSEERRVGKGCRYEWRRYDDKK